MSGYIKEHVHSLEFDGDALTVRVRPLSLIDSLSAESLNDDRALLEWAVGKLPEYVQVDGLKDKGGEALTTKDVVSSAYFVHLITELVNLLTATVRPADPPRPSAP